MAPRYRSSHKANSNSTTIHKTSLMTWMAFTSSPHRDFGLRMVLVLADGWAMRWPLAVVPIR